MITYTDQTLDELETDARARRGFLKTGAGAAVAVGGLSLLAACGDDDDDNSGSTPTPSPTPSPTSSIGNADVLNFALQLQYLEAQFYSYAAFGRGLDAGLLTGSGTQGPVIGAGAATGPRQVGFTDATIAAYVREIAYDKIAIVTTLRTALGGNVAAQPSLNLTGDATGAFTAAARAAQVVGQTATFDPYASQDAFLVAAFLFEDIGPTAYMGGVVFLTGGATIEAAAGIHAANAHHAGLVRTVLYRRGLENQTLLDQANAISRARDALDGSSTTDQGLGTSTAGNVVPADANAITFVRTPQQVLNVAFLSSTAVTQGGFFPAGVNGTIRTSGPV